MRGLVLGVGAAVVLRLVGRDLEGFPRAALLLALYLLVLAAGADVVWHVWICRKPAAVAALSGSGEMVPCYSDGLRLWVTGGAIALAAATTALYGGDAMTVLRAWVQLHRLAPPELVLRVVPSSVPVHQPFHLTVMVDNSVASRYRCEWQGVVGEWSAESTCDAERSAPLHFVEPDWPTRRVAVAAKVFDNDRLLGVTPEATVTVSYAPAVELIAEKTRIIQGQKAEFSARVDGHAPGSGVRCRWTVEGQFASSERCTFSYTGRELAISPSTMVRIGVEIENASNHSVGSAEASLAVDQPQQYLLYLVDASRRMAQLTPTGSLLDNVKNDLIDGLSNTDLGKEYLGVVTLGEDGSHPACYQNVQVPYPVQPHKLSEVKSVLYLLQPGAADAPLASGLLKGLALLRPYAQQVTRPASFALVSVAGGPDTCAGQRPEDTIKVVTAVMDGVRELTTRLNGRLLALTIGIGASDQDRRQWTALAKVTPTESPYVILPAPDVVTLNLALRAAVQLGSRDYDARLTACGDLARILKTRNLEAGAAQVDRYCRTLSGS